jgi:hypothetical protein
MDILFQAVAQLERLIDQAKMGDDKRVSLGLIRAQDCVLEQLWPSLTQADDDEVRSDGEPDPDHPTAHGKRKMVTVI